MSDLATGSEQEPLTDVAEAAVLADDLQTALERWQFMPYRDREQFLASCARDAGRLAGFLSKLMMKNVRVLRDPPATEHGKQRELLQRDIEAPRADNAALRARVERLEGAACRFVQAADAVSVADPAPTLGQNEEYDKARHALAREMGFPASLGAFVSGGGGGGG